MPPVYFLEKLFWVGLEFVLKMCVLYPVWRRLFGWTPTRQILYKNTGESADTVYILGRRISLKKAKKNQPFDHKRFVVVNRKEKRCVRDEIPNELNKNEVIWELPDKGFDVSFTRPYGEFVLWLALHLDFKKDDTFANWVDNKKTITEDDIRQIIANEWLNLSKANWNISSLNTKLEESGLCCTNLQFDVANEVFNQAGFAFLKKSNVWQCWQDGGQFSVETDRFTRRECLETLLPQRVGQEEARTEKYIVECNGKKMFFTFGKKVTFGRSRSHNIYFPGSAHEAFNNITATRAHLTLEEKKNGQLILTDTSSFGTEYNGQSLAKGKSRELIKNESSRILLQFANVLQISGMVLKFNETTFAGQWQQAGLPLEAFFSLCGHKPNNVNARCVCFVHLDATVNNITNPLKDEVYYAVLI